DVEHHLPRRPGQRNHGLAVQLLGGDLLVGYRVDPSCGLEATRPGELSTAFRHPRVLLPEIKVVRKPGRQEILEDLKRRPTGAAPLLKPATRSLEGHLPSLAVDLLGEVVAELLQARL